MQIDGRSYAYNITVNFRDDKQQQQSFSIDAGPSQRVMRGFVDRASPPPLKLKHHPSTLKSTTKTLVDPAAHANEDLNPTAPKTFKPPPPLLNNAVETSRTLTEKFFKHAPKLAPHQHFLTT